ncbi:hypothetical protein IRJ41_006709 [Triplophysa rosa]|uniref:Uncharacterized protein n=1 Tax=Triplophysa rosa TaxID=992332 RepID=A0A9W7X287_TRIRA|nr:hypothetical protein IRJ41_006709 [Triplophysa rosa]
MFCSNHWVAQVNKCSAQQWRGRIDVTTPRVSLLKWVLERTGEILNPRGSQAKWIRDPSEGFISSYLAAPRGWDAAGPLLHSFLPQLFLFFLFLCSLLMHE